MSQPERYEPRARSIGGAWKMVKCKDGPYVCFEQHEEIVAALAAENERLRSASFVTAVPSEEYEKLKAENERLRKAGDDVLNSLDLCYMGKKLHLLPSVIAWEAAKKGGDAK